MAGAEGDDEAVFQSEGDVEPHESSRTLAQVANVVLPVRHVVFYDHVTVPDAVVLVLLDHEVVVHVTFRRLLQRAQDRAPIVLPSLRADQSLRVDVQAGASVRFGALDDLNAEALGLVDFVLRHDYRAKRQLRHTISVVLCQQVKGKGELL